MTRKKMVRKFIESIREDMESYSRFTNKGNSDMARRAHARVLTKIDFARELGLIPTSDYYGYLMRIINLN